VRTHAGARVVLNGFAAPDAVAAEVSAIEGDFGVRAIHHGADMAKPSEISDLIAKTIENFGGLDILVNNAGIQHVAKLEEFPVEKWDAILAIKRSANFGRSILKNRRAIRTARPMSALPSPLNFGGALLLRETPSLRPQASGRRETEEREFSTLMRASQCGDGAACARLVRKTMPLLQRVLRILYGFLQAADRDDLMQHVLLSLHRAMATYDSRRQFVPWLMAIVHNKMVDRARRFARSTANEIPIDDWAEVDAAEPSASRVELRGDSEVLWEAISRLFPLQQQATKLAKLRELTSKEAAMVMGTTPGAVRVSVHRAINSLRASLDEGRGSARNDRISGSKPTSHSPRLSGRNPSDISNQAAPSASLECKPDFRVNP
jgi:RNA polymerase sigma factor (sigma-70 family)